VQRGGVVQVTIYFGEADEYLVRLVDLKSSRERKSRSAVIISLLEEHFESGRKLGEILIDLGILSEENLNHALELQRTDGFRGKLFGEVLQAELEVTAAEIGRALEIQSRFVQPARFRE
jgi:hypothetical protein